MTRCRNCGNDSRFALSVECTFAVPAGERGDPDWALTLQCRDCASTDLASGLAVPFGHPDE